ncbi:MAG: hypothetical protein METHP_02073 [Methanoregula sp. SKADARSKE-2]|nr:MAG: hypothetical protein METHP_02073 [Methanoregula sp. SKADARSKE-2]
MAGFLGTGIAIFLIILGMYRDQYVPYMAPGLQAHLIFLAGMKIVYLPVLIILSIFSHFSHSQAAFSRTEDQGGQEKREDYWEKLL